MTDKKMSDKKYPVTMTRKEIEVITSIIDCYIDSCVANRYIIPDSDILLPLNLRFKYIIPDSDILLPLNLRFKYRITEIKEEEAFAEIMNKGIKK
ncbi:hypothetical protein NH288_08440 [Anaerococcus sp. NML200537]|uniref:hypothetical protein n=1 Tax=Anaerococcus sp. NML200537 TaxID=2954485 RepID=UPI002237C863|nr:hypothetical protein [Anaerococcus sp. NML200537]MCW6702115.1 hypothetical protein [Anaerococcus sp. NML200537]